MQKWLRLGVMLALGASGGWAVDWKARYPKPEGYVSDFAHVIDSASRTQLESYAASLEKSTGAELAIVTIPSVEGEPVEDVANTIFRAWGVGKKGKDEGIMLLLAIRDRRSRIEVGYGLEPVINDGRAGDILRAMRPAMRQNDIGDALMSAAQTIGDTIAKSKNVTVQTHLPPRRTQPDFSDRVPWPLIVGGFFLLVLFLRARPRGYGTRRGLFDAVPWIILGNSMGGRGSYGGRGSGGFGGFDSGDSFGGFGGGDSGGGGASSDW